MRWSTILLTIMEARRTLCFSTTVYASREEFAFAQLQSRKNRMRRGGSRSPSDCRPTSVHLVGAFGAGGAAGDGELGCESDDAHGDQVGTHGDHREAHLESAGRERAGAVDAGRNAGVLAGCDDRLQRLDEHR